MLTPAGVLAYAETPVPVASPCLARRYFLRNAAEAQASEVELFLNSVPLLNPMSQEEKLQLVDAFEEKTYKSGDKVGVGKAHLCQRRRAPCASRYRTPCSARMHAQPLICISLCVQMASASSAF